MNTDISMADNLIQFSYMIQSVLANAGAPYELSLIQIRLLGILRDREPSMQQLAQHLELDKSSITGLIDRAERRGLVERVPSLEDRRRFNVRLTLTGRQITDEVGGEIILKIHGLTEILSNNEHSQLSELAAKIIETASKFLD
ncbi:MarR family winged helix-turn-helix transcriptional regulator [Paenibacillus sp. HW567]|uniref:MarR family winged helix-turn-helix transcriptional regulator n=1 Tax=Paenibacillus sp. HW567 TaxID=1034769 RepID=UPI00035DD890|nr:MarR family transcriptional regulator [Paenibacillus sp. HW567]